MDPLTTPPKMSDAHHVSKVTGIFKTGNSVFNDQIVATGARINNPTTITAANTIVFDSIIVSPEQSFHTNLQTLHVPLLLVSSFVCDTL